MPRPLLLAGAALGLLAMSFAFFSSDSRSSSPFGNAFQNSAGGGGAAGDASGDPDGSRVILVDQGLNLPIGSQALLADWRLEQDIATSTSNGEFVRDRLDIIGPDGEWIRSLGTVNFGPTRGVSFEQAWMQSAARRLEVDSLAVGPLQPSSDTEALTGFRRLAERLAPHGLRPRGLEAPLRGSRGGQPVEGVLYLTLMEMPQIPGSGTVQVYGLFAPPGRLAATRRAYALMAEGFEANPDHQQMVNAIGESYRQRSAAQHAAWMQGQQQRMQQMTVAHNQRMAANQARFDAHQQKMQGLWASYDAQMDSWRASNASSDEMQRRRVNGINETADIYDAETGTVYRGVDNSHGAYWVDPVTGTVVGTDQYSDNPDPYRYNEGTNLDDM